MAQLCVWLVFSDWIDVRQGLHAKTAVYSDPRATMKDLSVQHRAGDGGGSRFY